MRSVYSVIHAAALKRIEVGKYNPDEMAKTNVIGTMNVIEAARRADIGKVVLVSSDKAYAPVSPYGQSKAMAEALILQSNDPQFGPRFSVVRYGNVAGSTGSVIPTWRASIARGDAVNVTDLECTRFWMGVDDAAKLVVDTLVSMKGGELAVPDLPAYRLGDLAAAMGASYAVVGLGKHEKLHETMDDGKCSADARRMSVEELREKVARLA
jgi:FlaA1/EpsC-like NDP-sugar epimerase